MRTLSRTSLPLPLLRRGKVRDVYDIDEARVLIVATDRVSAFDVVMREPVPHKGAVLTQLTRWWLTQLEPVLHHHLITADTDEIVDEIPGLAAHTQELDRRSMLCRRATVFPVECVMRGYMSGSAWKEYRRTGTLAGEPLPDGFRESDRLPSPIFSPATKADEGHDENISVSAMAGIVGEAAAAELERLTRTIYSFAASVAKTRGIIIADTKVEFGYLPQADANQGSSSTVDTSSAEADRRDGFDPSRVILVDEVLTPDSSRFWPADRFEPGGPQPSFDKQPLRDYLDEERNAGRWNGEHPGPALPERVVEEMSQRYLEIYRRLTLSPLDMGHAI
ncbi:MAG TPA: phosphoribosylaminoimidazolesuccinocarboxamide synthase [Gemmatimonadaceae bacterium]|nr:phosphoribosylaminoimidazolesuccinocarboxamide synthase [Gemmatimonadaceae bacterium]